MWQDVMLEEYNSIMLNDVWEVVPRPLERAVVGSYLIYKIRHATDDSVVKFKARFMAKGFLSERGNRL